MVRVKISLNCIFISKRKVTSTVIVLIIITDNVCLPSSDSKHIVLCVFLSWLDHIMKYIAAVQHYQIGNRPFLFFFFFVKKNKERATIQTFLGNTVIVIIILTFILPTPKVSKIDYSI